MAFAAFFIGSNQSWRIQCDWKSSKMSSVGLSSGWTSLTTWQSGLEQWSILEVEIVELKHPYRTTPWTFFAQSMHIEHMAKHFLRKISSLAPPWGTWLRTHYWWDREEKKPSLGGIRIHDLFVTRRVLYQCATNALQLLPKIQNIMHLKLTTFFVKDVERTNYPVCLLQIQF